MTNRTVEIKGYGFGSTPAQITVTLEGSTVYTGPITTADGPVPAMPNPDILSEPVTLCTFEIPVDFAGEKAMTCAVSNGTVIFAQIDANYSIISNPVFSEYDLAFLANPANNIDRRVEILSTYATPPFSAEEITTLKSTDPASVTEQQAILVAHGVSFTISSGPTEFQSISTSSDARANVVIDGTPVTAPDGVEYNGTWWWKINNGSTMSYNLVVVPGIE